MPEIQYIDDSMDTEELLDSLSAPVRNWFEDKFPDFTDPQKIAIPRIMNGEHLLLCSPTGSGKTLTAFLSIIDDLVRKSLDGTLSDSVQCIYISPIKALANDIQKNLIGPLTEIKDRFLPSRAKDIKVGLRTGDTPQKEREVLFRSFRTGEIKCLVVSKVANFAIDLPDANVAIQVSGSFGSRQEEAQRLGRVLRPKDTHACFYTIITHDTKEQEFAMKRQLFLTEQGYRYSIENRD